MMRRAMLFLLFLLFISGCMEPAAETPPTTAPPVASTPADVPPPAESVSSDTFDELWRMIDGSTATIPLSEAIFAHWGARQNPIVHNTTPSAYLQLLLFKSADLIFVTYPSEGEFEMAAEQGHEMEIIPIVKDAFVFLVNAENPVENLTLQQYRDIYTGKITNWREVGGDDVPIIPYQRTVDSGSQTLFLKLVMDGVTPMDPPNEWRAAEMGALVDYVSAYDNAQNALGYSVFYYVSDMYGNERFKLLSVDGVKPTRATIAAGEYPLETYYYAVLRKDTPADSPARALVAWLLTDEGQQVAQRAGYVPLRHVEVGAAARPIGAAYLGDTTHSSGTGGTVPKTAEERENAAYAYGGPHLPLSDFFYDGVNYVAYLNDEIVRQLEQGFPDYRVSGYERSVTRPFTGIPADYPHVEYIWYGALRIFFPRDNPYFTPNTSFFIQLAEDMSPYADLQRSVEISYVDHGSVTPRIRLFTLRVELPDRPEASARINADVERWAALMAQMPEAEALIRGLYAWWAKVDTIPAEVVETYVYHLQPETGRWEHYLSVQYYITARDGPSFSYPMLAAQVYDTETGEAVNLAERLVGSDLVPHVQYENAFRDGELVQIPVELPEGVSPADYIKQTGAVYDCAWIEFDFPVVRYRLPDGTRLRIFYYSE